MDVLWTSKYDCGHWIRSTFVSSDKQLQTTKIVISSFMIEVETRKIKNKKLKAIVEICFSLLVIICNMGHYWYMLTRTTIMVV